jgi:DNA-directed RNA polymerase subunit beta'
MAVKLKKEPIMHAAKMVKQVLKAMHGGRVRIEGRKVIVSYQITETKDHEIPSKARLSVKDGDKVEPGQPLTEGSLNPHKILALQDVKPARNTS